MVIVQRGGIQYDLSGLVPGFRPTMVEVHLHDACGTKDCIQLVGYHQGHEVSRTGSQANTGEETLSLQAPDEAGYFTEFTLVGFGPFAFDHWWIIIIE